MYRLYHRLPDVHAGFFRLNNFYYSSNEGKQIAIKLLIISIHRIVIDTHQKNVLSTDEKNPTVIAKYENRINCKDSL